MNVSQNMQSLEKYLNKKSLDFYDNWNQETQY